MPVEIKGQQLRIRVLPSSKFKSGSFRTIDPGKAGRLQIIRGKLKTTGKFETQSYRFNLGDYKNYKDFENDVEGLRISDKKKYLAELEAQSWFFARGKL